MNDLRQKFIAWRDANPGSPEDKLIGYINQELLALYPGLMLRWSKIYGSRWAYLCGSRGEVLLNPVKIALNHDYGLYIDNPDIFNKDELENIILSLKELFANDANC